MGLLNLLTKDPLAFALVIIPLLFSVIIHEVAHGWVAYRMGDPTAKWMGRLTLNPLNHLDPIGTLMLFLAGFGWAKPVPVNFNNISDKRKGLIFVSSAGIVANILFAFVALLFLRLFSTSSSEQCISYRLIIVLHLRALARWSYDLHPVYLVSQGQRIELAAQHCE